MPNASKTLNAGTVYRIGRTVEAKGGSFSEWLTPKGGFVIHEIRGATWEVKPTRAEVKELGGSFVQPYRLHRLMSATKNKKRNS